MVPSCCSCSAPLIQAGAASPGGYPVKRYSLECADQGPDQQARDAHQRSLGCKLHNQSHPNNNRNRNDDIREYRHESIKDPVTHAFKEIVTIESTNSGRFQINLDIKPTACCLLEKTAANQSGRTTARKSLTPHDCVADTLMDGIEISQICENEEIIKSLGTIELKIFKCKLVVGKRSKPPPRLSGTKTTNEMSFSEDSKKARLSSTAGLGEPTVRTPKDRTEYIVRKKAAHPFLHFIFHYKPRSILVAEEVIPNPDIPTEPAVIDSSTASIPQAKPAAKSISIESDSEPKDDKHDKQKKVKKETILKNEQNHDKGSGSGCQCNCKNKRPADAESSGQKRARISDPDPKPDVNQTKHTQPSKPIFIDLTL
ncbi:hypothetical protein PTTG_28176 [Puccinia triticina 1-1 BBBD Race 1]|uniref:DUF7918 domain-containing protein n=1 Tax=Puccinia triticina (isolate 1-1 / race 1 (BBBD)) TaxID=630390 RepID=A0A180GFT4_PUCT1|nr:hypothetical protein PTTG_28176 [Puccinia triticina 1-1 BBBD Race 1]